mgnify:FL=1
MNKDFNGNLSHTLVRTSLLFSILLSWEVFSRLFLALIERKKLLLQLQMQK